jgi:hypothetical protein
MLAVHPAAEGGASYFSSILAAYDDLVRKTPSWPRGLGRLQPFIAVFPQERMNENCAGLAKIARLGPTF